METLLVEELPTVSDIPEDILTIYDLFVNFYGEENVDLQKEKGGDNLFSIITKWDKAIVKNEYDREIIIRGVYVRIQIGYYGKSIKIPVTGNPHLRRSIFTPLQWDSNYVHSHVSTYNSYNSWGSVCLGSRTQISALVTSLSKLHGLSEKQNPDSITKLDEWKTLVWEIDKMVHTESIAGTPYIRMDSLSELLTTPADNYSITTCYKEKFNSFYKMFIPYLIKKKILKFSFAGNNYIIADNPSAVAIKISDCFFDFMRKKKECGQDIHELYFIICEYTEKVIYKDGVINTIVTKNSKSWGSYVKSQGEKLFTFKGKDVNLIVKSFENEQSENNLNIITILSREIIGHILCCILNYLNINYGKAERVISKGTAKHGISFQSF